MRRIRILLGICCWLSLGGFAWWCLVGRGPDSLARGQVPHELWRYLVGHRRTADLELPADCYAWIGDPVFVISGDHTARQVGEISAVWLGAEHNTGRAVFYSLAPPWDARARLTYHETPDSIPWVLKTMLSDEKRQQINAELRAAFERQHDDLLRLLKPIAEDGLRDLLAVIEQDLPPALERHRAELKDLGDKYQREILERDLLPLFRAEIWPIVRRHAEPQLREIGSELWQRASLWRFGWRYLYDQSPLPDKKLLQQEWARFVDRDVVPVLEKHGDDFLRLQQQIAAEIAQNPRVHETVREDLLSLADDPELRRLAGRVAQEVLLDNPRLKAVLVKHWRGPRVQEALRLSATRFEPTAVRIGELLLGTPQDGITPELARVLRNQILRKDRRWLVLDTSDCAPPVAPPTPMKLKVLRGGEAEVNPFLRM